MYRKHRNISARRERRPIRPGDRLEAAFERQAQLKPDAIAIEHRGTSVRYGDLNARANQIAHRLRALDVGPESLVGLWMPRLPDMIASILGILKAGGAYLPLDPAYPIVRLHHMIEDSGAAVLLTDQALPPGLHFAGAVVNLAKEAGHIAGLPAIAPTPMGDARSLAYVIYTSGSTGPPKGVMIEHTATAFVAWGAGEFRDGELACVAAASSICFDPSVFEIFAPLSTGGTVLLKDSPIEPFTPDERPTMLNTVPSVLVELVKSGMIPESVRVINIGGEKLPIGLVHALYRTSGVERVYNHYGPTEATTCTTVALVLPTDTLDPPLGRPICDAEVRILRDDGTEAEESEYGEIHVAGPTLARGYVNDPVGTAERFVPDPRGSASRLYRTGDIGYWGPRGVEFVGRTGDFLKRNGFRIAPSEIELALRRLPGVQQAAIALAPDEQGRERLVAYLAGEGLRDLQLTELRRRLSAWLPQHMLPNWVQIEESLPLTLSGKIDRNMLPAIRTTLRSTEISDFPPSARAVADVIAAELNVTKVGPDDDFYELGGDSLQAVRVALRLEAVLGQPVSPAQIAQTPTPRLLHLALELERSSRNSHLTILQGEGKGPPLHCLPDIAGRPFSFISLAREMAPDQPVHGLTIGPAADAFIARPSIDLLMDCYFAAVRENQPSGRYRIAGYSFSGRFAQELARRLYAAGEQVSLVLIDAPRTLSGHAVGTSLDWVRGAWTDARAKHGFAGAVLHALGHCGALKAHLLSDKSRTIPRWVPAAYRPLAEAHLKAARGHKPQPFGGSTLVVMCTRQQGANRFLNMDGLLGWRRFLTGSVERVVADVGHDYIVLSPFARELALHIGRFFAVKSQVATGSH